MASSLNLREKAMQRLTGRGPGWSLLLVCAVAWLGCLRADAADFTNSPKLPAHSVLTAQQQALRMTSVVRPVNDPKSAVHCAESDRVTSLGFDGRDALIPAEPAWYESLPSVRPRWLKLAPSGEREELSPQFQATPINRGQSARCPECQRELRRCPNCSAHELTYSGQSPLEKFGLRHASNQTGGMTETLEHIDAEPDDFTGMLSFREDIGHAWYRLRDDVAGVAQPRNLAVLALAGAGAVAIHQDLDGEVRDYTARHPNQWGDGDKFLGDLGEPYVQAPVLAGLYFWSLKSQDEDLHDLSTTMWSAFTINGVSTVLLKVIVNSDRPTNDVNDGHFGFPSYHASSSFAIASVLNEYYGWQVGVPAYVMAGMIGWSRIDARHHDLSDVVFGAALGYVIGTSVARHQLTGDSRVLLLPWTEPQNRAVGMQMEWHF